MFFLVLVVSYLGFEGGTLIMIAPVPCLLLSLTSRPSSCVIVLFKLTTSKEIRILSGAIIVKGND